VAIISHAKVTIGRHDNITMVYVAWHCQLPLVNHVGLVARLHGGKIVAIRSVLGGERAWLVDHVRFIELLSIAINNAIAQVNVVAGQSDDALDNIELGRSWIYREEDDDVAVVNVAIRNQRTDPFGAR